MSPAYQCLACGTSYETRPCPQCFPPAPPSAAGEPTLAELVDYVGKLSEAVSSLAAMTDNHDCAPPNFMMWLAEIDRSRPRSAGAEP
jgi:hypothetical protein